jgi:hypothetical protein
MGKLAFIKMGNFHFVKDNVQRMRREVTDREEIFAEDTSSDCYPKYTTNS